MAHVSTFLIVPDPALASVGAAPGWSPQASLRPRSGQAASVNWSERHRPKVAPGLVCRSPRALAEPDGQRLGGSRGLHSVGQLEHDGRRSRLASRSDSRVAAPDRVRPVDRRARRPAHAGFLRQRHMIHWQRMRLVRPSSARRPGEPPVKRAVREGGHPPYPGGGSRSRASPSRFRSARNEDGSGGWIHLITRQSSSDAVSSRRARSWGNRPAALLEADVSAGPRGMPFGSRIPRCRRRPSVRSDRPAPSACSRGCSRDYRKHFHQSSFRSPSARQANAMHVIRRSPGQTLARAQPSATPPRHRPPRELPRRASDRHALRPPRH